MRKKAKKEEKRDCCVTGVQARSIFGSDDVTQTTEEALAGCMTEEGGRKEGGRERGGVVSFPAESSKVFFFQSLMLRFFALLYDPRLRILL